MRGEEKSMLQGNGTDKGTECFWLLTASSRPSPTSIPDLCPLAQPAGTRTYTEDVGGGRQRELHAIDDKGEGGQVLDIVTVHRKLQRGTAPGRLISPLRGPAIPITAAPGVLSPSPKSALGPEAATPILLVLPMRTRVQNLQVIEAAVWRVGCGGT